MTDIVYEHPLNEKIRTYLRLEYLFAQLKQLQSLNDEVQQQCFFNVLFDLIEVLERNDVRPELIKDLERCESQLVLWSKHPSVSDSKLQVLLQQAVRLQSELLRSGKLVGTLKDDKFLAPLRQRFSIPGGSCYFDMPQLQYWIHLDAPLRQKMAADWLQQIQLTQQAIQLVLRFVRERSAFSDALAENGFYQQNAEHYELLRLSYNNELAVYPTISGNRYRYAIRFMQLCDELSRSACDKDIPFKLACC
ncbi:cell division protein ZapD [Arsukibacterium sp.]|uniref:cell division protein ZapD n=1 Tax=Arsukibacterium sp. TaxID=1977258 RepID=UPI002FDB3EB7